MHFRLFQKLHLQNLKRCFIFPEMQHDELENRDLDGNGNASGK